MIEFKITSSPDQQFGIILNDRRVTFRFRYNETVDRWSFDLSLDDQVILYARRVVIGTDMLRPFDLDLGVLFAVPIVAGSVPDLVNLPNGNVRIYQASTEEFMALLQ